MISKSTIFSTGALLSFVLLSSSAFGASGEVAISVELTPVGDFVSKGPLIGFAQKKGGGYVAKDVKLNLKDLKSDIDLRDNHMNEKYFEVEKYPVATMSKGVAKDGKFKAMLTVHGVEQKIAGSYKVEDKMLRGNFKTSLTAFKIKKASYMGVGVVDDVNVEVNLPIK